MQDSDDGENSVLNKVLAEYMLRIDRGEPASREGFMSAHPGVAEELRAHFAAEDAFQSFFTESADGSSATNTDGGMANVEPGQVFGDYELLAPIGKGGMGVVFKAHQRSLNRTVAVKLISDRILDNRLGVERFSREVETAGNLRHPHIVMVHEAGNHRGQHYYSMDYIEGGSLAEIIRANPLSGRRAAGYLCKVAEAIHYAHLQGTLHRDIKPANILIDVHDEPHVADFGLAKRLDVDSTLTAECVVGSPAYMPPEQIDRRHGEVGPASDVYGLGATLYDLLTGRPPFRSETPMATLQQVLQAEPVAPRLLNADVDRDLETICLKCLAKEPARRYASAEALADDLRRCLRNEPIHARPVGAPERLWRWCRRSPLVATLIGATALSLMLGLAAASIGYFHATEAQQQAERNLVGQRYFWS